MRYLRHLGLAVALGGATVLLVKGSPFLPSSPASASVGAADTLLNVDSMAVAARLAAGEAWRTDFSRITVRPGEIVSGGPGKGQIPAIDDPSFVTVEEADAWLDDRSPVMVAEVGDEAKAYPLAILTYHEIVNDRVGGTPVAATYCPLCNTAFVFDARVDGRTLTFGVSGRLRNSDLIMFDRQTESWWQQATGEGIVGEHAGRSLNFLPANTLSWSRVKELYPGAEVLSRETGYGAAYDYGRNPYAGYDRPDGSPMGRFLSGDPDPRFPAMERVVSLQVGSGWAVPYRALREVRVVNASVGERPVAVFWAPGLATPLQERRASEGRDVGQAAAFDRRVGDRRLTFRWEEGAFRDRETGSEWNLRGRAVAGPLAGRELTPVAHGTEFWFAWAAFHPETEVWSPEQAGS